MNCIEITSLLEDLLGGDLDEAEQVVREHLAECPGCRRRHEWLVVTREAFRELPPERPRSGFDRRLAERIAFEVGTPAIPQRVRFWRRPMAAWILRPSLQWALAATILTVGLGGRLFLEGTLPGPAPADHSAAVVELERQVALEAGIADRADRAERTEKVVPRPDPALVPVPIPAPAEPEASAARPAKAPIKVNEKKTERFRRPAVRRARPEPRGVAMEAEAVQYASLTPPAAALAPSQPEPVIGDQDAGLDLPPRLGYVRAQDMPAPFRCHLDSSSEECQLENVCQSPGECSSATQNTAAME